MLTDLQLRNFRCFDSLGLELGPGFNFVVGGNGQGKTTILEAACVLLRLQSQRSSSLGPVVQAGGKSFAVTGHHRGHLLQFYYSALRRKIAFDQVEQRTMTEYLRHARVVSFANTDIELVRGSSEPRRRYLDFLGVQIDPTYRSTLRAYERVLRSRNSLLKSPRLRPRELAAYDEPFLTHGTQLAALRADLVAKLSPIAAESHRAISGGNENLDVTFTRGGTHDLSAAFEASRTEEVRLRQTVVGPHRDDLELRVGGMLGGQYASEGQQRTVALALKLSQARVLSDASETPLLLLDDIFGELDGSRRNALLAHLPPQAQKLVTATSLDWSEVKNEGTHFTLMGGVLQPRHVAG